MNEGANILKGRNNNQIVLDKKGGVIVSTGDSSIIINSDINNINQPSPSILSEYRIPNLTSSKTNLTSSTDIIPLYYPTESISKRETNEIINQSDFLLPEIEEEFTFKLYESLGVDYIDPAIINNEEIIYSGPNFKSKGYISPIQYMTEAEQTACDRNISRNKTFVDGFLISSPTRRYTLVKDTYYHGAFDIATPVGKSIKFKVPSNLASGGIILYSVLYPTQNKNDFSAGSGGYGILVVLKYHDDNKGKDYYIYLAHLKEVSEYINNLPVNSVIDQDKIIAYTGDTAWKNEKTDPHLHFEVREGPSKQICPFNFTKYLEIG